MSTRGRSISGLLLAIAVAVAVGQTHIRGLAQNPPPCPARPVPELSSRVPTDVCIPDGFTGIALDYFDDYSWRALVALAWPAAPGRRGVPAPDRAIATAGPRVFETYKPLWEIFHGDGSAPDPAFDAYDAARFSPCGEGAKSGDLIVGSSSGIDDIGQAGIGVLDPPIVAQNGRYVRTLTLFNQIAFDHIVKNRYFLRSELPPVPRPRPDRPVIEFPIGSVAVKSAWVDIADLPAGLVQRLHTRSVLLKRATGAGCTRTTVGLIGMHIAQKTLSRPQWIWSSFEQKDLVPPKWPDWPGAFVLNDGSGTPMPQQNPLSLSALSPEPARAFNIVRDPAAPILTSTELTSFAYQHLLEGTPWQYYRLVVTQWPRLEGNQITPIPASVDGSVANTFPGEGAFSAFANLTMETFNQKGAQVGCMSCHNRARMTADFMWTVLDHAHPARLTAAPGGPAR